MNEKAKPTPKQKQFKIQITQDLPQFGFSMAFNRFLIETIDEQSLIHFGLVSEGVTISEYSVLLEKDTVGQTRQSMVDFLAKIGAPSDDDMPHWRGPERRGRRVDLANAFNCAHAGTRGELRFGTYSVGRALEQNQKGGGAEILKISAQTISLLRCNVDVLKIFIAELYGEEPK